MSSTEIITGIICPLFGSIIANIMWFTPMPAVLEVRKTRKLGELNPYPFVITILNCVGWIFYGCLRKDYFIFSSNILGVTVGMFYTITALTVAAKKTPEEEASDVYQGVEGLLISCVFFWGVIGMVAATAFQNFSDPVDQAASLVGVISCACSIAYYGAPLAVMYKVITTKDSSSLYLPLIVINLINALLWFSYGAIALGDPNVWIPNGIGLLFSLLQAGLSFLYPKKSGGGGGSFSLGSLFAFFGGSRNGYERADTNQQVKFADILDADQIHELEHGKKNKKINQASENDVHNPMRR